MPKRKSVLSSDEEDVRVVESEESPERPLQSARRTASASAGGKKSKKARNDESEEESLSLKKVPKSKSTKAAPIKKPKIPKDDEEEEEDVDVGVNQSGERYVKLGKKRRATVNSFKGSKFLDIREFYGDDDDLKPGKKGISLTQEQWEMLKKSSKLIDSFFAKLSK